MSARVSRRGALRVLAAGAALPLGALALSAVRGAPAPVRWSGAALGALSSMTLWHPNPDVARRALARMLIEVDRLEDVFSLHRPHSELARLNRDGRIDSPSADLVRVFDHALQVADLSRGAFDPTIQPLWIFHASGGVRRHGAAALAAARARVRHGAVELRPRAIRFGEPAMAASLNGVAQGYITDRIAEILGGEGFDSAVIELGEIRALGAAPGGAPFPIALVDPASPGRIERDVALADMALAVSGGYGARIDGATHHIFDPATGESAMRLAQVAVVAPRALWADALSTAICVAGEDAARALLDSRPGATATLYRTDGTTRDL